MRHAKTREQDVVAALLPIARLTRISWDATAGARAEVELDLKIFQPGIKPSFAAVMPPATAGTSRTST